MNWDVKRHPMVYGDVKQIYPNIAAGEPALSKAVVIGNVVFLSGMSGRNLKTGKIESDSFEGQMVTALDNIRTAWKRQAVR